MTEASVAIDQKAAPAPVLVFDRVVKTREKGGVRFELKIPRLVVRAGEFLAVVGPSGCGKSTLLDLMGLVLAPCSYQKYHFRTFRNQTWADLGLAAEKKLAALRQQEMGYVLQSGGLLPFLSVRDNILLPAKMNGLSPDIAVKRLDVLVRRLNIVEQLDKKPAHLSGGQRQRAAIARALIHGPQLVLADEPTAAVDSQTALEIRDVFKDLTSRMKMSLVMVTHDFNLVRSAADRLVSFKLSKAEVNHTVSTLYEVANGRGQ